MSAARRREGIEVGGVALHGDIPADLWANGGEVIAHHAGAPNDPIVVRMTAMGGQVLLVDIASTNIRRQPSVEGFAALKRDDEGVHVALSETASRQHGRGAVAPSLVDAVSAVTKRKPSVEAFAALRLCDEGVHVSVRDKVSGRFGRSTVTTMRGALAVVVAAYGLFAEQRDWWDDVVAISRLSLALGEVKRATLHPDGVTPESDTTHSLMLALIAARLCGEERTELDVYRVLMFSLVHDLVEAYAGDVSTMRPLSLRERARKSAAESEAHMCILSECPWIGAWITAYERQSCPESRWVCRLDKVMPKLTHMHNGGAAWAEHGLRPAEARRLASEQRQGLFGGSANFPAAQRLFDKATQAAFVAATSEKEVTDA